MITEDQIERIVKEHFLLFDITEIRAALKEAYQMGYDDAADEAAYLAAGEDM